MRVSIIVSVFNNKDTVSDAINSIVSQDYDDIECIVVDAGSLDGTVEIIKGFGDSIDTLISEPDRLKNLSWRKKHF